MTPEAWAELLPGLAAVLAALADLAWPSVVVLSVLLLRKPLADLIRHGKGAAKAGGLEVSWEGWERQAHQANELETERHEKLRELKAAKLSLERGDLLVPALHLVALTHRSQLASANVSRWMLATVFRLLEEGATLAQVRPISDAAMAILRGVDKQVESLGRLLSAPTSELDADTLLATLDRLPPEKPLPTPEDFQQQLRATGHEDVVLEDDD